jgi:putative ABC transport system permease protein
MVMSPLRRKVLRDLRRLWAQVLAIALVLAAGVATLILGNGAYSSLTETRARYYDDSRFADVFADVTRAPLALLADIEAIDGVLDAEARIVNLGRPDLPGMAEPPSLLLVSLPQAGDAGLNRLYLRQGRLPDPNSHREIVVSEGFAQAHRLSPGAPLTVVMNGRSVKMQVTGTALSPEFIYALGPGDMMPDPRRFGIAWAPRASLEAAFTLEGAFSNVVLKLMPGVPVERVIEDLDRLTARYGGTGATGRKDQISHAFLDAELNQLSAMVKVLPPIFLLVAAMLVNMTLSRLITLEREQIGLLKAIGYSSRAVALHYIEFVLCISLIGIAVGLAAGAWLGAGLAGMYARFFSFPFLVFTRDPQVYGLAALVAGTAAAGGALRGVQKVARLPPAVAMLPSAPSAYQDRLGRFRHLLGMRQTSVMIARHLVHWPVRTLFSIFGVAMSVAILVASLWSTGSINFMVDVTFFQADRQDALIAFATPQPVRAVFSGRNLPGVLVAEPFRTVLARISHRAFSRRVSVMGRPHDPRLSRVLAPDLRPMTMPETGLILSEALAEALGVRPGDRVTVEFLEGPAGQRPLYRLCGSWGSNGSVRTQPDHAGRRAGVGGEPDDRQGPDSGFLHCRQGGTPDRIRDGQGNDGHAIQGNAGRKHHRDDHGLFQSGHDHRRGGCLQLRADRPFGTGPRTGQPSRAGLHASGSLGNSSGRADHRGASGTAAWLGDRLWHRAGNGRGLLIGSLPRSLCDRAGRLCDGQSGGHHRRPWIGLAGQGPDQQARHDHGPQDKRVTHAPPGPVRFRLPSAGSWCLGLSAASGRR